MLFLVFIKLKEVFYIYIMDKKFNIILDFWCFIKNMILNCMSNDKRLFYIMDKNWFFIFDDWDFCIYF